MIRRLRPPSTPGLVDERARTSSDGLPGPSAMLTASPVVAVHYVEPYDEDPGKPLCRKDLTVKDMLTANRDRVTCAECVRLLMDPEAKPSIEGDWFGRRK